MRRAVIESPLSGNFARNLRYARLCAIDSLRRGEAPYASHLFFTQVLNDALKEDRALGMAAGLVWSGMGQICTPYVDLGITDGMHRGMDHALACSILIEHRHLPQDLLDLLDAQVPLRSTEGIR